MRVALLALIDLDHHDLFLSAKEEPVLIDHGLDDVLQVGSHGLKLAEVTELVLEEGRPPANGQILAVHAVILTELSYSESGMKVDVQEIVDFNESQEELTSQSAGK